MCALIVKGGGPVKVSGTRRQTASTRPGKVSESRYQEAILKNNIDSEEDIQRCLSCTAEYCDGNCQPKRTMEQIPEGFSLDVALESTVASLSRKYHVSTKTVHRWKRYIEQNSEIILSMSEEDRKEIVLSFHKLGLTDSEIAAKIYLPTIDVAKIRQSLGLMPNITLEQKKKEALKMLRLGYTYREVAKEYNVTHGTIRNWKLKAIEEGNYV